MSGNAMLLGFTVPDAHARAIFGVDSRPAVQTHKFAWSIARSLQSAFDKLILASVVPMQNFPLSKKLYVSGGEFQENGINGVMLSYVNVVVIKHLTRLLSCLLFLPKLIHKNKIQYIFVHGVHTPFLVVGAITRLFRIKFYVILTDPPGVILPSDSWLSFVLKMVDVWGVRFFLRFADGAIALSPALAKQYARSKPCIVFPGILSSDVFAKLNAGNGLARSKADKLIIVYAGGLDAAYGVDKLLDAMGYLDDRVQLRLFGRGDQEVRLGAVGSLKGNVYYGGFINDEHLIPELLSADLLINPRPTSRDFSIMSFPSKLIEYLATARPVLTTRIASIPAEYSDLFLYIDDESSVGIRDAIVDVFNSDRKELNDRAFRARKFVVDNASESVVGCKIRCFVQSGAC